MTKTGTAKIIISYLLSMLIVGTVLYLLFFHTMILVYAIAGILLVIATSLSIFYLAVLIYKLIR